MTQAVGLSTTAVILPYPTKRRAEPELPSLPKNATTALLTAVICTLPKKQRKAMLSSLKAVNEIAPDPELLAAINVLRTAS